MKEEQKGGVVCSSRALNLNLSRKRSKATTSIGGEVVFTGRSLQPPQPHSPIYLIYRVEWRDFHALFLLRLICGLCEKAVGGWP